jgi:hypothetical protein
MSSSQAPRTTQPVEYKGEPLDAARGPGLGCFWLQIVLLAVLVVLTPLSAMAWDWPMWATGVLFVAMLLILLLSGQTMIFLLRIVAAGREEGRRRPLASTTPTVGELEDVAPAGPVGSDRALAAGGPRGGPSAGEEAGSSVDDTTSEGRNDPPGMRQ